MSTMKLYQKLAVERCRMSLAQLCAAAHFLCENRSLEGFEADTFHSLIAQIDRDMAIIEKITAA
jgi:hypothetical protein